MQTSLWHIFSENLSTPTSSQNITLPSIHWCYYFKTDKSGKNLVNFLNDRNTKHASIKFAFNYSTEKIRCCSNTRMVTFRPHFTEIWLITKILALNIQASLGTKKECSLQSGAIRKRYMLNSNWIHKNTLRHLKMHLRTYGTNRKILERKLRKLRKRKEKYFK